MMLTLMTLAIIYDPEGGVHVAVYYKISLISLNAKKKHGTTEAEII